MEGVVSPRRCEIAKLWLPLFDNFPAHRTRILCSKPLRRTVFADDVAALECGESLVFVADWTLLFGHMHTAKIPILPTVCTPVTTLLDSLADRVLSHASLELRTSHIGSSAKCLSLQTLSNRFFNIQAFDENSIEFL